MMNKKIVSTFFFLLIALSGCYRINELFGRVKLEDSHRLGQLSGWILPDNWIFVQNPFNDTRVLSYDVDEEKFMVISTPDLGFAPYAMVNQSGTIIGYTDINNDLRIFDIVENKILYKFKGSEDWPFAFSPKDDKFAVWNKEKLFLVDMNKGIEEVIFEYEWDEFEAGIRVSQIIWRPGTDDVTFILSNVDREFIQNESNDEIIQVDTATGSVMIIASVPTDIWNITWSPNGQFLAYAYGSFYDGFGLRIIDAGQDCVIFDDIQSDWFTTSFWSPNGERILYQLDNPVEFLDIHEHFGVPYEDLSCQE